MPSNVESIVLASLVALSVGAAPRAPSANEAPTATVPGSARTGNVPAALAVPAGHELAFEVDAKGVQIYVCGESGGAPAWAFQAPEAKLVGPRGEPAGTHYAGPTWEAADGSKVVGAKVEGATPDPAAIPWLLLRAASHDGNGRMAAVTFVQRIQTRGGVAPAEGCGAATAGAVARVPYRAVYSFYRKAPGP